MITPQSQIKLNLPLPLKKHLENKASQFGMPIAGYIKHLILKDVEDMEYPTFEASDRTIKAYKRAMKNKNKAIVIKTKEGLNEFFDNL